MPTILLIRHGQASFGTADYDRLSPLGVRQAGITAAALVLCRLQVSRVVSGDLRRQIDTATPAADAYAVAPGTDARWDEYAMDDVLAAHNSLAPEATIEHPGMSSAAFQDVLEAAILDWIAAGDATTAPESWPAFRARVERALDETGAALGSGETALVFTSGGVVATVCAHLLGLDPRQLVALNRVAVNTAVTKVAVGRRGLSLIAFNDHSHLEGVGRELVTYR